MRLLREFNQPAMLFHGLTAECFFSRRDCDYPQGASRAVYDFQGSGDDHCAGGRKLVEVAQAGQPEFSAAMHHIMIRKWRIKISCAPGIGADRLYTYS